LAARPRPDASLLVFERAATAGAAPAAPVAEQESGPREATSDAATVRELDHAGKDARDRRCVTLGRSVRASHAPARAQQREAAAEPRAGPAARTHRVGRPSAL